MKENLNFYENGRQPQFLWKWKTTSISLLTQRKTFLGECWPSKLQELEEDLNSFENEIQPQFLWKWKTASTSLEMEDNLNFTFGQLHAMSPVDAKDHSISHTKATFFTCISKGNKFRKTTVHGFVANTRVMSSSDVRGPQCFQTESSISHMHISATIGRRTAFF